MQGMDDSMQMAEVVDRVVAKEGQTERVQKAAAAMFGAVKHVQQTGVWAGTPADPADPAPPTEPATKKAKIDGNDGTIDTKATAGINPRVLNHRTAQ